MNTHSLYTDVLIVGAGPSGLMMACQLLRFGVQFRIIDKQPDRAQESRAFAIQAKSMEILQNLGLAAEFVALARSGVDFSFFVRGKKQIELSFQGFNHEDTPFPTIYFLPQAETERILIQFLEKQDVFIERPKELLAFSQDGQGVKASVKDDSSGKTEIINCTYIVGCDGAHSTIRHRLNVSFAGAAYQQNFVLADVSVNWPFSQNKFLVFLAKQGLLLHIPLTKTVSRLMLVRRSENFVQGKLPTPSLVEIENTARLLTGVPVTLTSPVWLSQFHLHHRCVSNYSQGRAFLAGDAAHIHSPAGGQGMNTGIQDVTNLAWKIALVLRKGAPSKLLASYESERHRIGKILLRTTDRIFSLLTSKNGLVSYLRNKLLPLIILRIFSTKKRQQRLFGFISQLNIHYHDNDFLYEVTVGADAIFAKGPHAGYRAPDAPTDTSTLFALLRNKPFNLLLLQNIPISAADYLDRLQSLEKKYADCLQLHFFTESSINETLFARYGVTSTAFYFIRPDGYIGFRSYGDSLLPVETYLKRLFGERHVMNDGTP